MVNIITESITILLCFFLLPMHQLSGSDTTIETVPQATTYLSKLISNMLADNQAFVVYQKEYNKPILICAKILYDNAFNQILDALSEVDSRIAYWQYQKDHPWNYFISKNPAKWISGPSQGIEVINHLEVLKSHQGELYVLLGQLSELGTIFMQEHKTTFLIDQNKAYEWINKLLDALIRIRINKEINEDVPFIAQIKKLQLKLENVNHFKSDLLADTVETEIPSYLAQNWLKGGLSLFTIGYGYKNYYNQFFDAMTYGKEKSLEYVVDPVAATLKDVFLGNTDEIPQELLVSQKNLDAIYISTKNFLNSLTTEEGTFFEKDITEERKQEILEEIQNGGSSKLQALSAELSHSVVKKTKGIEAKELFLELSAMQAAARTQKKIEALEKQWVGLGKIAFITPAIILAYFTYTGYQKLTEKNYTPLRRALVDINSLFIDPSKPLTDEQYGKMIYLIHMLKRRAAKELPVKKNIREDFIQDLEKIESSEFNIAAKRAIVEDMFKKYHFLGIVQKK